jgi:hypothetical protein
VQSKCKRLIQNQEAHDLVQQLLHQISNSQVLVGLSVCKSAASALNSQVLVDQFANQLLLQSDLKPDVLNFWVSRKYVQICLNRNETSQKIEIESIQSK